jgi:hypothetical protein
MHYSVRKAQFDSEQRRDAIRQINFFDLLNPISGCALPRCSFAANRANLYGRMMPLHDHFFRNPPGIWQGGRRFAIDFRRQIALDLR